jgi:SAM-dependent methyltransferase
MDRDELQRRKAALVERYGPWTAHNIQLRDDLYTMVTGVEGGNELRLRRIVQLISDLSPKPLERLRVVDLGCLEGLFAVEFARRGADVVGIEAREPNIEKARFSKAALALDNLEFVQGDVRDLSRERYGGFDVVLALGILYHLDAPDVFVFLERLADVCDGLCVLDTHVTASTAERFRHEGRGYWGRSFAEADTSDALAKETLWAALGNPRSVLLTRHSLFNALAHAGFTTAFECKLPPVLEEPDRGTFVAVKGRPEPLASAPLLNGQPWADLPETHPPPPRPRYRRLAARLPRPVRGALRRALRSRGL